MYITKKKTPVLLFPAVGRTAIYEILEPLQNKSLYNSVQYIPVFGVFELVLIVKLATLLLKQGSMQGSWYKVIL